jgi:hypothetical protein
MNDKIQKKEDFGKIKEFKGEPDYSPESIKKQLAKNGTPIVQKLKVKGITGKETAITIRRDGTQDSNLALSLADPKTTRDQKDHAVSMWLYEKGKESGSFLVDLMRFKGHHTNETRAFKTQMRFDFEMFVESFTRYLRSQENAIVKNLMIGKWSEMKEEYISFIKKHANTEFSFSDFVFYKGYNFSPEKSALIEMAMRSGDEAEKLTLMVQKTTENRMREKGFGIYIDSSGRIYSIFDNDMEEAIEKDKADLEKLKKKKHGKE